MASADRDVGLSDLAADPLVALLARALSQIDCRDRDRQVHIEYRRQWGSGDRSPASTVASLFGLRADHVRQIDRRVRTKLQVLAGSDPTYAAAGGPAVAHRPSFAGPHGRGGPRGGGVITPGVRSAWSCGSWAPCANGLRSGCGPRVPPTPDPERLRWPFEGSGP